MPVAGGKLFKFESEECIRTDFLETITYDGNPQEITYETEEFTAVCPFSGLPDTGKIVIVYIPGNRIVELKSLKYYFISFRNVGVYQEAATNRIFNDLFDCLNPRHLTVKTMYNVRGGIASTCIMDSERMRNVR